MLLVVDAGNTSTVFGLAESGEADPLAIWRFASTRERTADDWLSLLVPHFQASGFALSDVTEIAVASVVPPITRALVDLSKQRFGVDAWVIDAFIDLGIEVVVDRPEEVGADRLVNAAFAFAQFGGPTIVVDLGTATKVEAVTETGRYLGGAIAPGIALSLEALTNRAAKLYAVELQTPPTAIGSNTVAAVQSGVVLGHHALVEGMIERISRELGTPDHVVLTGGYSSAIAGQSKLITDYIPDLTLRGLIHLHGRNRRR